MEAEGARSRSDECSRADRTPGRSGGQAPGKARIRQGGRPGRDHGQLAELGLTLEEVLLAGPVVSRGRKARKAAGAPAAAKFRGPNGEEWSGRGRLPRWLRALEAGGKSRDQFRV